MTPRGIPEVVLIAPDAFKGTLSARAVAAAIGRGVESAGRPVDLCPVADGGEGTADALAAALGARIAASARGATVSVHAATVSDPLGRPVEAHFTLAGDVAVLDTAAASGLALVAEVERDALAASTAGTGELIAAAIDAGARTVLLGAGGSATTDGGAGAIRALARAGGLRGARLVVLCDVRTPFEHAARVFAPQKGASERDVARLSARLGALARRLPRDPRGRALTGAAGGLAGGLWAALGAELVAGAGYVLDELGFDARMRAARVVVTGEGRLDRQSLAGKVVSEVSTRARQAGVPCRAVVGVNALDGFDARVLDLELVLEAGSEPELEAAGHELAERL